MYDASGSRLIRSDSPGSTVYLPAAESVARRPWLRRAVSCRVAIDRRAREKTMTILRARRTVRALLKAPLYVPFGVFAEIASGLTDAVHNAPEARRMLNAPATGLGALVALAGGATCNDAQNGLIVCSSSRFNPGGDDTGGTTFGEVFVTKRDAEDVLTNKGLLAHEQRHSEQWAGWGLFRYPLAYAYESGVSNAVSGSYGSANYFEWDAGMVEGGYVRRKMPRRTRKRDER